ncbi:M20 family metallopeptidase [Roseomonas haemaphysalidis]|uniref:M20 family metallopeptidase n=1 Tax=Roseomonas haemaphysalidis TaxID=2768162 RepID=A0ABS3KTU5_9PROT|nr:M20 family metallopeptidase [Roseomonas haemaphysalidis]MBO1080889.1 M20 family metallopeptidase [Roseomonas haemaphysalidis]
MTRDTAIRSSLALLEDGRFQAELARRVAFRSESQNPAGAAELDRYLSEEMIPALRAMGFACEVVANSVPNRGPFLIAQRIEDPALPTVLVYGHGDVVHGQDEDWREGLSPWVLTPEGERWYGRGTADNKGQHGINLAALREVLAVRGGRLGFNAKVLLEMGEESGSPGLAAICRDRKADLAADVLIASDGPRLSAGEPTIFLGSRGAFNVGLELRARERAYHSGNWGGVILNPATVLSHAIASMVDARGRLLVDGLLPPPMPNSVRAALAPLRVGGGETDPAVDEDWGAEGLTPAERLFGWNTLEVLAIGAGNAEAPMNAVPPVARATVQLRYVVGTDAAAIVPALRAHLDARGFQAVRIVPNDREAAPATRLDPDSPWVRWAAGSIAATLGRPPAILPNIGGSLPNHVFADILGLPTLWVPHSYAACAQHAPDEHVLVPIVSEGLRMMAGLFWDLGENAPKRG